jgi:hypothetical protein
MIKYCGFCGTAKVEDRCPIHSGMSCCSETAEQAQSRIRELEAEIERIKGERDTAWKKNGELFRLLRDCKEVTYKHHPALNIRICDALSDY